MSNVKEGFDLTFEELQTQLIQYVEQQQLLLTVTRQISGSIGLSETLPHILGGINRALKADVVRLLLVGFGRGTAYATGPLADQMGDLDAHLLELASQHGEFEIVRDETGDSNLLPPDLEAVLVIPLIAHQTQHGILWLGFQSPHHLGEAERTLLSILAGQAAIAVANSRSFEAARRRREWLAAILASTPDPVLVVDHELCLQLINPAAQETFGVSEESAMGEPLAKIAAIPDLLSLFSETHDPDEQRRIELSINGRTYSPSISHVRTERDESAGSVLVLRDITHFKRLNDNMSEFLSTVSHDMRSPLTFMKGYLDMLGMIGELNERQTEFAEKIAVGVIQMSDMVEKILEAGKLDPVAGTYQLLREPTDVVEVLQKMMSSLSEPAAKKEIELTAAIAPDIPILNVDRAMLSSAFTNLAENAVKYTPEGGKVHVDAHLENDQLLFSVQDNGYGISPENQKKLFQRNVRVHRKEWKRVKGSGLGLFIVKNVAQRHGGDAWVESVEGQGSTFFLSIPLAGSNLIAGDHISGSAD
ncbi:MAG TPA: ATP-binding protein [Aggregatilineaceae bacterium]|nr:ATP-binding protein [Aggregatilineaceae bacterium]